MKLEWRNVKIDRFGNTEWRMYSGPVILATAWYTNMASKTDEKKYKSQIYIGQNSIPARMFVSIEEAKVAAEIQIRTVFRAMGVNID